MTNGICWSCANVNSLRFSRASLEGAESEVGRTQIQEHLN
jgi:hypothetical protein